MVKVFYLINKKKDIESEIFENFQYREEINYRATKFSSYVHRLVLRLFAYTDKNRKGKTWFPPVSKLVSDCPVIDVISIL